MKSPLLFVYQGYMYGHCKVVAVDGLWKTCRLKNALFLSRLAIPNIDAWAAASCNCSIIDGCIVNTERNEMLTRHSFII